MKPAEADATSSLLARLGALLARTETRFAGAGVGLLLLAVLFALPATKLHAASRLLSSPFEFSSEVEKQEFEKQTFAMYLPRKGSLRFFSLGNDGLAADYVWIKAAGYVTRQFGTQAGDAGGAGADEREALARKKFEWLSKLYNTTLDLDPNWVGACRVGAMILAAVGSDPSGAVELLERGISSNPDSWLLPHEAGVTMLMWPGHQQGAARYFRMAMQRPMDPEKREAMKLVVPRLMAEAGQLELAIKYARDRAASFADEAMGEAMRRKLVRLVAEQMQNDIRDSVKAFRERSGRSPADIAELRRAGLLVRLDVHFASEFILFGERLETLAGLFRRLNPGAQEPANILDHYRALAASGFLHRAAIGGLFDPPEWRDTYGKPFLYHPPTGTVRSRGLAEVEAQSTTAILNSAAAIFSRRKKVRPETLEEVAAFFGDIVAQGRQLEQRWVEVFKTGRPPEHPLAAWGGVYEYDPATGLVKAREGDAGGSGPQETDSDPAGAR